MNVGRWLFAEPDKPVSPWRAILWWEARRIPFNLIVGAYGLVCLAAFLWAITASGRLPPGEDAVEPIALLAAPLGVNVLYTLGWLLEAPIRLAHPGLSGAFSVRLLKLGLALALVLMTLPAVVWAGIRVLQLLGAH